MAIPEMPGVSLAAPDDCLCKVPGVCLCPPEERALRQWSEGGGPPMTAEQREWCLCEIEAVEGYSREDCETNEDALLATTVLSAWTDFCRDKGLLP